MRIYADTNEFMSDRQKQFIRMVCDSHGFDVYFPVRRIECISPSSGICVMITGGIQPDDIKIDAKFDAVSMRSAMKYADEYSAAIEIAKEISDGLQIDF